VGDSIGCSPGAMVQMDMAVVALPLV